MSVQKADDLASNTPGPGMFFFLEPSNDQVVSDDPLLPAGVFDIDSDGRGVSHVTKSTLVRGRLVSDVQTLLDV